MPDNTTDNKRLKLIQQRQRQRKDEHTIMLETVLKTYEGRTILWELLSKCKIYTKGFVDGNVAYYYQGMRDIGIGLIEDIMEVGESYYNQMVIESQRRQEEDERRQQ